jgi:hypothetical protein
MGFNRRKMEDQRRDAAEKEAAKRLAGIAGSLIAVPSCVQKDHDKCGEQTDHHCDGCPINVISERVNHCLSRQRGLMVVFGINSE